MSATTAEEMVMVHQGGHVVLVGGGGGGGGAGAESSEEDEISQMERSIEEDLTTTTGGGGRGQDSKEGEKEDECTELEITNTEEEEEEEEVEELTEDEIRQYVVYVQDNGSLILDRSGIMPEDADPASVFPLRLPLSKLADPENPLPGAIILPYQRPTNTQSAKTLVFDLRSGLVARNGDEPQMEAVRTEPPPEALQIPQVSRSETKQRLPEPPPLIAAPSRLVTPLKTTLTTPPPPPPRLGGKQQEESFSAAQSSRNSSSRRSARQADRAEKMEAERILAENQEMLQREREAAAQKEQQPQAPLVGKKKVEEEEVVQQKLPPTGVLTPSGHVIERSKRGRKSSVHVKEEEVQEVLSAEEQEEEEGVEDDDPDRLWCICRKPHNNRFMIQCDECSDWFHGKCVNVTKAQGKVIEDSKMQWHCPACKKKLKEQEGKKSISPLQAKRNSQGQQQQQQEVGKQQQGKGGRSTSRDNKTESGGKEDIRSPTTPLASGKRSPDIGIGPPSSNIQKKKSPTKPTIPPHHQHQPRAHSLGGRKQLLQQQQQRDSTTCLVCGKSKKSGQDLCSTECALKWAERNVEEKPKSSKTQDTSFLSFHRLKPSTSPTKEQKQATDVNKAPQEQNKSEKPREQNSEEKSAKDGEVKSSSDTVKGQTTLPSAAPSPRKLLFLDNQNFQKPPFSAKPHEVSGADRGALNKPRTPAEQQRRYDEQRKYRESLQAKNQAPHEGQHGSEKKQASREGEDKKAAILLPPKRATIQSSEPPIKTQLSREDLKKPPPHVERKLSESGPGGRGRELEKRKPQPHDSSSSRDLIKKPLRPSTPIPEKKSRADSEKPSTSERKAHAEKPPPPRAENLNSEAVLRQSMKRSLTALLQEKLKQEPKIAGTQSPEKLAASIEQELINFYGSAGNPKCKAKFRSLLFNLKNSQSTLPNALLSATLLPSQLVRMDSAEMAPAELTEWRQRESQRELEAIKRAELDKLTEAKRQELIEKGAEIEQVEKVQAKVELLEAEPNVQAAELESEGTNTQEEKESKPKLKRSSSSLLDSQLPTSKPISTEPSKTLSTSASPHISQEKTLQPPPPKTPLQRPKLAPPLESRFDEDSEVRTPPEREEPGFAGSPDQLPSSTVKTPDFFPTNTQQQALFTTQLTMQELGTLNASVFNVSHSSVEGTLFPESPVPLVGRIAPETVWDYIDKMRKSKELLVFRLSPATNADTDSYMRFFAYLSSRGRLGVLGGITPPLKDVYLVPLDKHSPVNRALLPFHFSGPGISKQRSHCLLAVVTRNWARPLPSPRTPEPVLVPPRKKVKFSPPQDDSAPYEPEDEEEEESAKVGGKKLQHLIKPSLPQPPSTSAHLKGVKGALLPQQVVKGVKGKGESGVSSSSSSEAILLQQIATFDAQIAQHRQEIESIAEAIGRGQDVARGGGIPGLDEEVEQTAEEALSTASSSDIEEIETLNSTAEEEPYEPPEEEEVEGGEEEIVELPMEVDGDSPLEAESPPSPPKDEEVDPPSLPGGTQQEFPLPPPPRRRIEELSDDVFQPSALLLATRTQQKRIEINIKGFGVPPVPTTATTHQPPPPLLLPLPDLAEIPLPSSSSSTQKEDQHSSTPAAAAAAQKKKSSRWDS